MRLKTYVVFGIPLGLVTLAVVIGAGFHFRDSGTKAPKGESALQAGRYMQAAVNTALVNDPGKVTEIVACKQVGSRAYRCDMVLSNTQTGEAQCTWTRFTVSPIGVVDTQKIEFQPAAVCSLYSSPGIG